MVDEARRTRRHRVEILGIPLDRLCRICGGVQSRHATDQGAAGASAIDPALVCDCALVAARLEARARRIGHDHDTRDHSALAGR